MTTPTLYSYCLRIDDGAAPNPFWDTLTLAICKPVIRRVAEVGDWIVGTGSRNSPVGDTSGHVIYAMRVDEKITMAEYDEFTLRHLPNKIPDWTSRDHRRRLGDSIYDSSSGISPELRPASHDEENMATDLGGQYVLLSQRWYYFGRSSVPLPSRLQAIVKQGQGHKSQANAAYVKPFLKWIATVGMSPNTIHDQPQLDVFADDQARSTCAGERREEARREESFARHHGAH